MWSVADLPAKAGQAVKDYLATLDDAAFGAASDVRPKFVSPSDPAAQWTGALRGPAFFAYTDNYLVDTANAIIVDVEASPAIRQAGVGAARAMIDRVADRFDLRPKWLAGDSAYGGAPMLAWLVRKRGISPHVPVLDKSRRDDNTLARADFAFDAERNLYVCPQRVTHVRSSHDAAREHPIARSRVTSTKMLAMWRDRCLLRPPSSSPAEIANGSRCCSRISSASSSLAGCGCADHVAHRMSSYSPLQHKT